MAPVPPAVTTETPRAPSVSLAEELQVPPVEEEEASTIPKVAVKIPPQLGMMKKNKTQGMESFVTQLVQKHKENPAAKNWNTQLRKLVHSVKFTVVVTAIVLLHAVFIFFDTNLNLDVSPGSTSFVLDCAFTTAYIIEAILRLAAVGQLLPYLEDRWNRLDVLLIVVSLIDICVISVVNTAESSLNLGVVVLRLARLLRLIRLFRFFKSLFLLAQGIATSMRTVLWAWLLLGILIYMFGLFFARVFEDAVLQDKDLHTLFGTVDRSMFSVFQCITIEDWNQIADVAGKHEPWTRGIFMLILVICPWGILHVVVAIFVESAVEASSVRSKDLAKRATKEYGDHLKKISDVFRSADTNSDGILSRDEFAEALQKPSVVKHFAEIGVDHTAATALFDILDLDQSGTLDGEEFVEGIMRSRGLAQNKDVIAIRCDVWRVQLSLEEEARMARQFIAERTKRTMDRLDQARQRCGLPATARRSVVNTEVSQTTCS